MNKKIAYIYILTAMIYIVTCFFSGIIAMDDSGYYSENAGFRVKFEKEISRLRIASVMVLPGESIELEAVTEKGEEKYELEVPGGEILSSSNCRWVWKAPAKNGVYPARVIQKKSKETITLNIFVMVPYEKLDAEYINGYRIGRYPSGLPVPEGFIEVTKENEDTLVSPHFQLKQFLCKQPGLYPKYVVLSERLPVKLELILEKMNERGFNCSTFHVMSGYRTPYYNRAIGNVKYSRHIYGDAADIFIDELPVNFLMDDLNADSKINYKDAIEFYNIIDSMCNKEWYGEGIGGLGWYNATRAHGPFVHVDVRGYRARWCGKMVEFQAVTQKQS